MSRCESPTDRLARAVRPLPLQGSSSPMRSSVCDDTCGVGSSPPAVADCFDSRPNPHSAGKMPAVTASNGPSQISLDDLYVMTAQMYSHRNEDRPASATFAHFVEVCAALTAQTRQKRRESLDFPGALCKALGWYFPLLAKLNVRSVEELIFRKFPGVCPYCRSAPHDEMKCKLVKGTDETVDHAALREKYHENTTQRPVTLDQWREMFATIYPRQLSDVTSGRKCRRAIRGAR